MGDEGRTGVWLVGARGSLATTVVVGASAVRSGLTEPIGCVSTLPPFAPLSLGGFGDLVFGGHDVNGVGLTKRAERLVQAGVVPHGLPDAVHEDLLAAEAEIRFGTGDQERRSQAEVVDAFVADLDGFRRRNGLARVIVVNVSSTEAPATPDPAHESAEALMAALDAGAAPLPPSSLYALAAIRAGCPYVDFTPSTGIRLPALRELAEAAGLPYAGNDGKTGETLVKSVLAPMFASRALRVTSWSGANLLGGGDGATLADPERARSKTESKRKVVPSALGYEVDGDVAISNVPSLGDWKTAWNNITFTGFLGTAMTMQFTWQGCDSALAAPLILDLVRFTAAADAAGLQGPLTELAFFFKDPIGTDEHGLVRQFDALVEWARGLAS